MMTSTHNDTDESRNGVALILCLGILSVMTILSVAFAISMRIERLAARNFANGVRAEHLVQVALVRAIEDIDDTMLNPVARVYPDWSSEPARQFDAMCSDGPGDLIEDIISGEASNSIPAGDLLDQANALSPRWITNDIPRGRIGYAVINVSGLQDVNYVSGSDRQVSTNVHEIDISGLPEFLDADTTLFVLDREEDVRYETIAELAALNDAIDDPVQNLWTYSFDEGRDSVFLDTDTPTAEWWTHVDTARPPLQLGRREAVKFLHDKFRINEITNYTSYSSTSLTAYKDDDKFKNEYMLPLSNILQTAGIERPGDVVWNIINYLDPDRIPQSNSDYPWQSTEGGEAIPLINEIVLEQSSVIGASLWMMSIGPGPGSQGVLLSGPAYTLSFELWYPFAPIDVEDGEFSLQVGIFSDLEMGGGAINPLTIFSSPDIVPELSYVVPIGKMEYGTDSEFLVFSNTFAFAPIAGLGGGYSPIGETDTNSTSSWTNDLWILARVLKNEGSGNTPVDEAMGFQEGPERIGKRRLFRLSAPQGYAVNDPRSNGQVKYWTTTGSGEGFSNGGNYPASDNSLGTTNLTLMPAGAHPNLFNKPICDPWEFKGHGVPIYATNGLMRNIGELGHIYRSNLDDENPDPDFWFWRNINLMRSDEGAMLMDILTVRSTNAPSSGLFSINSRQWDALATAFTNLSIGIQGASGLGTYDLDGGDVADLIDEIIAVDCVSFTDLFTAQDGANGGGGDVADAFRQCAPQGDDSNDLFKEDTFRHICELITFRQNIFAIVLVAQALAPHGDVVVAERRAIAMIYRDAYTGRHFTRSFKWLTD